MKDYIKKKLKKICKYSVQGHKGGKSKDEKRAAAQAKANRIQANADRVFDTFNQLSPPFGADLLLGSARLSSIELLSDGPIKGFFDVEGKNAPVLNATFLDDIPVVASVEKRVRHKNLKLNDCKACQIDYTTGVRRYLMDFRAYLSTGIGISGRKQAVKASTDQPAGYMLRPYTDSHLSPDKFRGTSIRTKDNLEYSLGGSDRDVSVQFAANPGINTDSTITNDLGLGQPAGWENYSGAGYRISPYGQQSFYGQDQISDTAGFNIPSSNSWTTSRPLKYQGATVYGAGLNTQNGNIETSFMTRAFTKVLKGFVPIAQAGSTTLRNLYITGYATQAITNLPERFAAWGKSTGIADRGAGGSSDLGPLVVGDIPYIIRHYKLQPGSEEPFGLIEPHISGIFNLNSQLPNQKEARGFIFKQKAEHDLSRFTFRSLTGAKHETLNLGGQINRNVLELRAKSEGVFNHFSFLDFSNGNVKNSSVRDSQVGNDKEYERKQSPGYVERADKLTGALGLGLKGGETYRFTGSVYIPAGAKVSGIRFFTDTPISKLIGGPPTIDTRSNMDQWFDFNSTWTASTSNDRNSTNDHAPGLLSLSFMDFTTDNSETNNVLGQYDENDQVFIKNLTISREDYLNEQNDFVPAGNTGYLIFPADSHTFFTANDEDSRIKPGYDLSFSFGSGAAIKLDEESLKYVMPDVEGFSGIRRDIKDSIVLETDLKTPGRTERRNKPYNITGNLNAYSHVVGLEEKRAKRFKGAILFPVYLGPDSTAMSGINEEFRLESLSRVMIFTDDDHEVKQLKYQSGVEYNYDVFSGMEDGNICYSNLANPNIISSVDLYSDAFGGTIRPTGHGYPIQIRLEERDAETFNYPNILAVSRDGSEVQNPMTANARSEISYQGKTLLGPHKYENISTNPNLLNLGVGGVAKTANEVVDASEYTDQTSPKYVTGFFGGPSLSSADQAAVGEDDFNDWNSDPFTDHDEENLTHIVQRSEVKSIEVVFNIFSLVSQHIFDDDPDSSRIGDDRASLNLQVEAGFEGVSESDFQKTIFNVTYVGIASRPYAVKTNEIPLPSYQDLLDSPAFINTETIDSLKLKYKRYVKVRKLDFETLSTRIDRKVSVYSIIENIDCKFSYPFSALVRTELDARNFQTIPTRTYNTKLKKVNIPSNYFPLRLDGTDKRFIKDASTYQKNAKIYDGDWDGSFKFEWTDNPAWILYDLLTNTRYGIGNFLDDTEDINIFNLYKIARYCDAVDNNGYFVGISDGVGGLEPRYSANLLINQSDSAFEMINQITAIFNGNAFWANGVLDFYSDRPLKPAAFFNNGNVFDGYFTYQDVSKSSNFNCVTVQFQDKNDDFKISYETVEDEDGIRKDGKLVRELNGRGTTSRGQARRLAKYVLYSNKLEREIVYFKAGLEALMVNVGDIIEISDELKQFEIDGARVLGTSRTPNQFGSFRYFRFLGTNSDDSAAATRQAIAEIHLIDDSSTSFPTSDFGASPSPDGGGNDVTGPFTNGGITVSAGYSQSNTYAPHNAFDGTEGASIWWTLGLTDATLNHLDVDFGSAKNISQIQVSVAANFHDCPKLRILGSNSADFSSFEVFGEIDYQSASNVDDLAGDTLTVNVDDIITVGASKSTSTTSIDRGNLHSILIENTIDINSIDNEAFVYAPSGQTGVEEMYDEIRRGGFVTNQSLSGMDAPQAEKLQISSAVPSGDNAIKLNFTNVSGQTMDLIRPGSFANINLTNNESQTYRVIKVLPEEEKNIYSITATQYNSGKFNFIEGDEENFNLSETTPFNIGIPENNIKELTQPLDFFIDSPTESYNAGHGFNVDILGALDGNEDKYLITIISPNGNKYEKRIKKSNDLTSLVQSDFGSHKDYNTVLGVSDSFFTRLVVKGLDFQVNDPDGQGQLNSDTGPPVDPLYLTYEPFGDYNVFVSSIE